MQKPFEPQNIYSAPHVALLGEKVPKVDQSKRSFKHKVAKLQFSQFVAGVKPDTKPTKKRKNIRLAEEKKDKSE